MPMADGRRAISRVLLKVSGEALMGERRFGIDPTTVERIADEIAQVHAARASSSAW